MRYFILLLALTSMAYSQMTHTFDLKFKTHSGLISRPKDSVLAKHDGRSDTTEYFRVRDSSSTWGGTTLYVKHSGEAHSRITIQFAGYDYGGTYPNRHLLDSSITVDSLSTANVEGVQNDSTVTIPLGFRIPKGTTHVRVIFTNGAVVPSGNYYYSVRVKVPRNMPKIIKVRWQKLALDADSTRNLDSLTVRQDGRADTTEPVRLPRDSSVVLGGLYCNIYTDGTSKGLTSAQFGTFNGAAGYVWGAAVVLDSVTTVNSLITRRFGRHQLAFRKGTNTHVRFISTDGASALVSSLARKRCYVFY